MSITMGDIAERAGVSRPTVSRGLRGDPRLSAATIQKVQDAAKALGYQRNPAFDALAACRRSKRGPVHQGLTIAWLQFGRDAVPHIHGAAKVRAQELGYRLEDFIVDEATSMTVLNRMLWSRGITGIIVPPIRADDVVPDLNWERYSVVACGVDAIVLPFHTVLPDVYRKASGAWEACRGRGYRRIGVALPMGEPHELDIRRLSLLSFLKDEESEACDIPVWRGHFKDRLGFQSWVTRHRPEAVILGLEEQLEWIEGMNVKVPAELAVCCLMVEKVSRMCGYGSRHPLIGETAIDLLHQEITHSRRGMPEKQMMLSVQPEWRDGTTLPFKARSFV